MQLAMVLMGYSIERQTNKRYLRDPEKKSPKFYYSTVLGDIRGLVYILVSWTLHFLTWGLPGLWEAQIVRWGIAGQYAFVHQYQKKCGDPNFQMPAFVDVLTMLEIGFLGLVATSPEYLKPRPVPKAVVSRYSSVTQLSLLNNRTVSVPANTTCYSIGTGR
jgi:hypothetical protein